MSDLDEARAIRYFLDAFCDRDTIGLALSQELYPVAIFHSQQVCEKCAKGCLALSAIMIARDHHASDLFNSSKNPGFRGSEEQIPTKPCFHEPTRKLLYSLTVRGRYCRTCTLPEVRSGFGSGAFAGSRGFPGTVPGIFRDPDRDITSPVA